MDNYNVDIKTLVNIWKEVNIELELDNQDSCYLKQIVEISVLLV